MSPQLESLGGNPAVEPRNASETTTGKKTFVEPMISVPVDVLEATAFFMQATISSGNTLTP